MTERDRFRRSTRDLEREVQTVLMREFDGFDCSSLALRIDGESPDRSVFAVAHLPGCGSVAVARVYEADLGHPDSFHVVYMTAPEAALFQAMANSGLLTERIHCQAEVGLYDSDQRAM